MSGVACVGNWDYRRYARARTVVMQQRDTPDTSPKYLVS